MIEIRTSSKGLTIKVYVQPKSSRNQIAGRHGDAIKLKITAPPVQGAANKMSIQLLAAELKLSKSRLEIVSGQISRTKRILIRAEPEDLAELKNKILSLTSN